MRYLQPFYSFWGLGEFGGVLSFYVESYGIHFRFVGDLAVLMFFCRLIVLLFILGVRIFGGFDILYRLRVPVFIWRLGEFGCVVGFYDESFVACFRELG